MPCPDATADADAHPLMARLYGALDWGARVRDNSMLPYAPCAGVILHHTQTFNREPREGRSEEGWVAFYFARGLQIREIREGKRDLGYHILISRGGIVMEGRQGTLAAARLGRVIAGYHTKQEIANHCYWGVACEGTYHEEEMPAAQWQALVFTLALLLLWARLHPREIRLHSEFGDPSCPGARLAEQLERLQHEVQRAKVDLLRVAFEQQSKVIQAPSAT